MDPDHFPRHPHEPFDVADLGGFLGQLEDGDVPSLGLDDPRGRHERDLGSRFHRIDAIARKARLGVDLRGEPAVLAGAPGHPESGSRAEAARFDLAVGVDLVDEAALRAGDFLMPTHQRRGHRPSGNHEAFRLEAPDQEPDENDHERLDRLAPVPSSRAVASSLLSVRSSVRVDDDRSTWAAGAGVSRFMEVLRKIRAEISSLPERITRRAGRGHPSSSRDRPSINAIKSRKASSPGVEPGLRPSQSRVRNPSHSEDLFVDQSPR